MWDPYKKGFKAYLQLERSLSENSVEAYLHDVEMLTQYLQVKNDLKTPQDVELKDLQHFLKWITELGMSAGSQARIISGLRQFYKYCLLEQISTTDPTALLEAPKLKRSLPDTLSYEEIESMINKIDLSKPEGGRNKAILETMYSCGLRVSELVNLRFEDLHFDKGFIRVIGKGNKERLVPVSPSVEQEITSYRNNSRSKLNILSKHEKIVFLNRRGAQLTRVMIFTMIKQTAIAAGIHKPVSPHTFRHSFATHLLDGGADIRVVQELLGHASVTTTQIYTLVTIDRLREAYASAHPRAQIKP